MIGKPATQFVVIYRTGGTDNFQWHRTMAHATRALAEQSAQEVRQMGYAAHVENYALSMSIGLPETADPNSSWLDAFFVNKEATK